MEKEKRKRLAPQTLGEEIGNAVTHGLAFIAGIVGIIFLLVKSDRAVEYVGSAIFGASIMILYLMSCLYHAFRNDTKVKRVFKRFDHLSIYLLIGGTFAPMLLCAIQWPKGLIFFILQWILIIFGIVLKAINTQKHHVIHIILYLAIGWSALFFVSDLIAIDPMLFILILLGGIIYSLGLLFYAARFKYAHFVWHFFCIGGTIFQFIAIYKYVLPFA